MSNIIQIIRPKKKKHNFHLQIWRTPQAIAHPGLNAGASAHHEVRKGSMPLD